LSALVTEELQVLWALAGLDEKVVTLQTGLARYPGQRAEAEQRLGGEKTRLEALKQSLHDLQLKRRQMEKDIETLAAEERKFQGQLPMVKKNEEYTALLHEIAGAKKKRSDRETDLLVLMDEEEKRTGEKPALERALATAQAEVAERIRTIAAAEQSERDRVAALESERATLLARLPVPMRTRYERIRVSMGGRAVVPILKGACGGCYRGQSPQTLQEAKRGDRLLVCDGCGRLLILPPDAA
jgi:predicted  nucleic acid-binding Zn-ribbon protein